MNRIILMMIALSVAATTHAQTLQLKWKTDTVLRVPESVLFDAKGRVLYVSNIDGKSTEKDGKGFISKLSPEGKVINLQWASGLNAPKGMGIYKKNFYVADLTRVAVIDLATGKLKNSIEIEGAQFLNDITIDEKGNVYVSDSATGKIHRLNGDKAGLYFEYPEFKRVNGLLALKNDIYVVDAGTGKNYKLSAAKKLTPYAETGQGADGIVVVGADEYIVSSWPGEIWFVDAAGKSLKLLDTKDQQLNSADIDYDARTKTVFVPTFNGNSVMAYEFKR